MAQKRLICYALLLCLSLFALAWHSPTSAAAHTSGAPQQMAGVRLLIPRINVNAPVERVAEDASGSMAVPIVQQWTGVGWYIYGPYPGDVGSAVIDGHLDRPGGSPAVFWNLRQLRAGDQVFFDSPGKPRLRFRVTKVATYTPATAPLDAIFNNTRGRFLNLVTCAGQWIPRIHQTTLRLVVYTTLI